MSGFPPPPSSVSGTSINGRSSSLVSISFSELTGRSPRTVAASQPSLFAGDAGVEIPIPQERATTAAEQLRSALERRTRRTQESSSLSSDFNHNSISASSGKSLLFDSTPSTSLSYSHNASAILDSPLSGETLPQSRSQSHLDDLRNTSTSDSLLQQAQSSPPRSSHSLISTSHVRSSTSPLSNSAVIHHTPSPDPSPRPQLLFAIASDQPTEVERLLSTGMASANETTGSGTGLLEFTVSNEGLKHKTEIVKVLLKYGADPNALKRDDNLEDPKEPQRSLVLNKKMEEGMNPALKYYLNRPLSLDVDSKPALEALQQSSFAPLARARFDIIGQDRVLDEFYRVLGTHSKRKGKNALVILLCGASGHGKSLLAQKVGSLLNVPTHTINMTALRSQHDLWQCLSTGIEDASPHLDLGEFLVENQGKRCVIVLDEMEKVDDPKSLNPLLLPWDIGRCSLEQKKHTDTSQAIWIATSNLGQQLIFEHVKQWGHPDTPPTRVEYTQLATAVRRRIAEVLGASLLSRVTIILPFLPFSEVEKIAIGTEAALWHQELMAAPMSSADIESIVRRAVRDVNLVEEEGARSLYRVVETHMIRA
ncbi:P-loop containing nucleoside triphosphate hydrolase protein [Ramaria rubella]|nr:P-loop containing nucleoside triphosphate hydrolase protein [Ramaria rubella]